MKKIIFITFLIFAAQINLISQWQKLNEADIKGSIMFISVKGNDIFAGTYAGGILYSTDNGLNWSKKNTGLSTLFVTSLQFGDNDDIFLGTEADGVFYSSDYGNNWIHKNNGINNEVWSVLISGNKIFAGTVQDGIYVTTDKGENWISTAPQIKGGEVSTLLNYNGKIIAGGWNIGGIYISSDNGEIWSLKNSGLSDETINKVYVYNNTIFAGTHTEGIFISTNDGNTWVQKNSGLTNLSVRSFAQTDNYIFAGTDCGIFLSSDNGNSWTPKSNGLTYLSISSLTIKEDYIFAGSYGNTSNIYRAKLSDFGITGVQENYNGNDLNIFPNPATDFIEVNYKNNEIDKDYQVIRIYNIFGIEVMTNSNYRINISELPLGLYYIKIGDKAGKFVKM